MTPLKRALIEKSGHDYGFENAVSATADAVTLGSALHPAQVEVLWLPLGYALTLVKGPPTLLPELERSFSLWPRDGAAFVAATDADLAQWLRRASTLAQSLPNQAAVDFDTEVQRALAELPSNDLLNTEVHRLVRQRVGQDRYRQAMLAYWGGACAVTGLTLAPALRASHAKPWAECASDSERLDVFNGFLLSANLDALFDKFLITFSDSGRILINSNVAEFDRKALGIDESMSLRWVATDHLVYLKHHQNEFFKVN